MERPGATKSHGELLSDRVPVAEAEAAGVVMPQ